MTATTGSKPGAKSGAKATSQPAAAPNLPRLYLATPPLGAHANLGAELEQVLDAGDVAAVLLRLAPADDRSLINRVKALAPSIQARGIAVLLEGHVELVARSGADGAHITGIESVKTALSALKPERIVGAGGLHSRHDAMTAGEAGADYVLFGEPDANGRRPKLEAIVERLQWWTEIFEPPCVGYAQHLSEVAALAATGAEFILLGDAVWADARGPLQALRDASEALAGSATLATTENPE